mmetsp:Transcript_41609/g.97713  ORF Transcript_41609/g.97713 Transcript_41609/m.97713 type:complete len:286 (+) Transcript_41609:350-1207(+)
MAEVKVSTTLCRERAQYAGRLSCCASRWRARFLRNSGAWVRPALRMSGPPTRSAAAAATAPQPRAVAKRAAGPDERPKSAATRWHGSCATAGVRHFTSLAHEASSRPCAGRPARRQHPDSCPDCGRSRGVGRRLEVQDPTPEGCRGRCTARPARQAAGAGPAPPGRAHQVRQLPGLPEHPEQRTREVPGLPAARPGHPDRVQPRAARRPGRRHPHREGLQGGRSHRQRGLRAGGRQGRGPYPAAGAARPGRHRGHECRHPPALNPRTCRSGTGCCAPSIGLWWCW